MTLSGVQSRPMGMLRSLRSRLSRFLSALDASGEPAGCTLLQHWTAPAEQDWPVHHSCVVSIDLEDDGKGKKGRGKGGGRTLHDLGRGDGAGGDGEDDKDAGEHFWWLWVVTNGVEGEGRRVRECVDAVRS